MNIRILREEIRQVFEAMNEQMEIIQQHKDKIPQIEIDLFMSNVRNLYEACISLNKLNMSLGAAAQPVVDDDPVTIDDIPIRETIKFMSQVEETPALTQEPEEESPELFDDEPAGEEEFVDEYEIEAEPDIPEDVHIRVNEIPEPQAEPEPLPEPEIIPVSGPDPQPEPTPEPEPMPEYEPIVLISPKPEAIAEIQMTASSEPADPQPLQAPSPDLFSTGTTIAEKLKEEKVTFNQRLQAENPKMNIGAHLHHNQIRDLKSSIGINEKFQFINDLFKGNMQDYTLAITQLNQFNNFEEALEYIDILKFKYTWDINSDAHHKLMDFVRRRYL